MNGDDMPARILVIDDEVPVRELLRMLMEGAGYEVLEAANGEQGLALYRSEAVDLVITDIVMPEMNGLVVIREIRRETSDAKIIAIAAYGDRMLPPAHKAGANLILPKPFRTKEMLEAVEGLLTGGSQAEF